MAIAVVTAQQGGYFYFVYEGDEIKTQSDGTPTIVGTVDADFRFTKRGARREAKRALERLHVEVERDEVYVLDNTGKAVRRDEQCS